MSSRRIRSDAQAEFGKVLLEAYAVNDRMNQIILEHLDPGAWRATLPGASGRNIAAIFSHVHNIRRKWIRLSAPHLKLPAPLNRTHATQEETRLALAESGARCCEMLAEAFGNPDPRIRTFHRDGWAKPWPAGAAMFAYMLTHDVHHRGQVCMLAHQLGFPLPPVPAAWRIWNWEKLWKECGFTRPR